MSSTKPVVLHLITSLRGGPGRLLCDVLSVDEMRGRYAHVVLGMYPGDPALARSLDAEGVPVSDLGMGRIYDLRAVRRLSRRIRDLRPGILHTSLFRADLYGQFLGKSAGVPVRIASILNTDDLAVREDYGRAQARLFVWLYRGIARRASAFVASARAVADNLAARGIRPPLTAVAPNAIDVGSFVGSAREPRAAGRARHGFAPGDLVIGSASVHHRRKGLAYLIEAFDRIAASSGSVRLLLPGAGPAGEELRAMVRARAFLRDRVVFPGPTDDMAGFLDAIDIYVQPALSEGLPLALLQAMAAGKPIVATRVGGVPEALRDGLDGLLVEPRDAGALAAALERLIPNPALRAALGGSARARARAEFDAPRLARDLLSLYDQLVTTSNRKVP